MSLLLPMCEWYTKSAKMRRWALLQRYNNTLCEGNFKLLRTCGKSKACDGRNSASERECEF